MSVGTGVSMKSIFFSYIFLSLVLVVIVYFLFNINLFSAEQNRNSGLQQTGELQSEAAISRNSNGFFNNSQNTQQNTQQNRQQVLGFGNSNRGNLTNSLSNIRQPQIKNKLSLGFNVKPTLDEQIKQRLNKRLINYKVKFEVKNGSVTLDLSELDFHKREIVMWIVSFEPYIKKIKVI